MRIDNSHGGLQANEFGEDGLPWDGGWQPAVAEQHPWAPPVGPWSPLAATPAETNGVSSWNAGAFSANEAVPVAPASQPDYSLYDGRSDVGDVYSESGAMAPALPVEFNEKACGVDAHWLHPRQPERDSAPVVAPILGYSESGEPIQWLTVVRDLVVADERARIPERGAFPGHALGRPGEQGPLLQAGERPATGLGAIVTEPPRDRSAEQWDSVRQLWTEHQHDPYRLMQQMIEREVDAKDIAFATGQSLLAMDDYFITRGAPQGFAGITPVDRDAVQADYLRAIDACVQSGQGVGWAGEGGAASFDIAVFNAWYARQDTPLVHEFLRLHGEDFSRSGASVSLGAWHNIGDSSEVVYSPAQISWVGTEAHNTQTRIEEYLAFRALRPAASNLFMIDASLHSEETQLLLSHYAHLIPPMPESRRTEQLRAIYGDARAELIHQITQANLLGVNGAFNSAIEQASSAAPPVVTDAQGQVLLDVTQSDLNNNQVLDPSATQGTLPPGWLWSPHQIITSTFVNPGDSAQVVHTYGTAHHLEFNAAAYANWYAQQNTIDSQLFARTYGHTFTDSSYVRTNGNGDAGDSWTSHYNQARTEGGWTIDAITGIHGDGELASLDLTNQRNLRDDRIVIFNPLLGLVTPTQNIYINNHAFEAYQQVVLAATIAVAGIVTGGAASAGFAAAGFAAGSTVATVGTAAAVGAVSSMAGQLFTTGEVGDWDAVLRGAVIGAVTAGFAQASGLNEVGLLTDAADNVVYIDGATVVQNWGTRLAANGLTSAFNGLVADMTGGSFRDTFVSSFFGRLGADLSSTLSLQVSNNPDLSPTQQAMGRVLAGAVGRAVGIMGNPSDADYGTAVDFLSGLGIDVGREFGGGGAASDNAANIATSAANWSSTPVNGLTEDDGWTVAGGGNSGAIGGGSTSTVSNNTNTFSGGMTEAEYGNTTAPSIATQYVDHEPSPTVSFHPSDNYGGANGDQSVAGHSVRVTSETASISQLLGTSNPQAIGNFMRANNLSTSEIFEGQTYFIPDSRTAYGDQVPLGQAALNRDNARIAQLNAARARAEAEAAARAPVQMIPNPLGFFEYVPADSPMGRLLLLAQTDPALASQIMEYRDSIRREFIGQRDAEAALLASPRAQSTLRSDYPPPSTPLGASMSAWDGVVRESAIARMDREARAPGANRIEDQVGPVIQPFVLPLVPGGSFLSAVMGARQVGEGWAQIENGDTLMGAMNIGLGSLQVVGSVAAMSRPLVAGTSGPVRDNVVVPSARNPVYDFELLPNGNVVPVRANGIVPLTPAQLTSTGMEAARPVVPEPRPWGAPTVHRGDRVSPEVVFQEGFRPRGTHNDLDLHVNGEVPGNFVSTSQFESTAVRYANQVNYVYSIRLADNALDVSSVLGRQIEGEYAFPGGIPPQNVMGYRQVSVDANYQEVLSPFVPNPNFRPAATPVTPTPQVLHAGNNDVLVVQDAAGTNFVGKFPTQDVPAAEQASALARERQAVINLVPYGGPAYLGDVVMPDGRVGVAMQHIVGGVSLGDVPTFPVTQAHVNAMMNLFDRFAANNVRPDDHHASNYLLTPEGGVVPIDSVLVPGAMTAEMRAEMLNLLQERLAGRLWDAEVTRTSVPAEFRDLINRFRAAEQADAAGGTTAQQRSPAAPEHGTGPVPPPSGP